MIMQHSTTGSCSLPNLLLVALSSIAALHPHTCQVFPSNLPKVAPYEWAFPCVDVVWFDYLEGTQPGAGVQEGTQHGQA